MGRADRGERAAPVMWRVRGGPATGLTQAGRRRSSPAAMAPDPPRPALSGDRSGRDRDRAARDPLVRARLYRRPPRRLVAMPGASPRRARLLGRPQAAEPGRHRRPDRLGGARRRARRPRRLRAVLQFRRLSRAPVRDLRGLARRHVVPRRLPRRGPRRSCSSRARAALSALAMLDLAAVVTPIGLFFGRIANFINGELWGRPAPRPSLRLRLPERRPGAAPSEPALRGLRRRARAVRRAGGSRCAGSASAGRASSAASSSLGYAVARIVCEFFREPDPAARLPVRRVRRRVRRRHHHGDAAVAADGDRRRRRRSRWRCAA